MSSNYIGPDEIKQRFELASRSSTYGKAFSKPDEPIPAGAVGSDYTEHLRKGHHERFENQMGNVSREEFLARLEASEARVDARFSRFESAMSSSISELSKEVSGFRASVASEIAGARGDVAGLNGKLELLNHEVQNVKGFKKTIWAAAATVIAVFVAVMTLIVNTYATGLTARPFMAPPAVTVEVTPKPAEQGPPSSK